MALLIGFPFQHQCIEPPGIGAVEIEPGLHISSGEFARSPPPVVAGRAAGFEQTIGLLIGRGEIGGVEAEQTQAQRHEHIGASLGARDQRHVLETGIDVAE
jgi:hypothetical protein